jgi:hypothetical protein
VATAVVGDEVAMAAVAGAVAVVAAAAGAFNARTFCLRLLTNGPDSHLY